MRMQLVLRFNSVVFCMLRIWLVITCLDYSQTQNFSTPTLQKLLLPFVLARYYLLGLQSGPGFQHPNFAKVVVALHSGSGDKGSVTYSSCLRDQQDLCWGNTSRDTSEESQESQEGLRTCISDLACSTFHNNSQNI